jgi:hypothetical protein
MGNTKRYGKIGHGAGGRSRSDDGRDDHDACDGGDALIGLGDGCRFSPDYGFSRFGGSTIRGEKKLFASCAPFCLYAVRHPPGEPPKRPARSP